MDESLLQVKFEELARTFGDQINPKEIDEIRRMIAEGDSAEAVRLLAWIVDKEGKQDIVCSEIECI